MHAGRLLRTVQLSEKVFGSFSSKGAWKVDGEMIFYPVGIFSDILGQFSKLSGGVGVSFGALKTVSSLACHLFSTVDHSLDLRDLCQSLVRLQLALTHLLVKL